MNILRFTGVLALAALLLTSPPTLRAQNAPFTDAQINVAVESRLYASTDGRLQRVDATTRGGIVTLTGTVDNLISSANAGRIATAVRGVRDVVNKITVTPRVRPDLAIANDVQAAIHADPATDAFDTKIAVNKGVVLLTGKAQSYQEKMLAESTAASVVGVRAVQNQIEVNYPGKAADEQIVREIVQRLEGSAWIDHTQIGVNVKNGDVTLTGRVGSAVERKWVHDAAWVQGTRQVDHAKLQVVTNQEKLPRRTTKVSDEAVANAVQTALNYDSRVNAKNVGIAVLNGVVTLTGTVDSYAAKLAADADTRAVRGVWDVKNVTRVRTNKPVTDEAAAVAVRAALIRDPFVDRQEITVRVVNGQAHLYGEVDSAAEKLRAAEVASTIRGVVHVANHVKIDFDDTRISDFRLKKAIEDRLWWSPLVDRREVDVAVDAGIATLTGSVDTFAESSLAEDHARQAGADRVVNRLQVEFGPGIEDILP